MPRNRLLSLLLLIIPALLLAAAGDPPPMPASQETQAELSAAFFDRLDVGSATQALTFNLFTPELDTAFLSPDGQTAVLWLALRDDYGRLLATEPGLALARMTNAGWQVLLPGDPDWEEMLTALPADMLPLEQSPAPDNMQLESVSIDALTGYYLPYVAGTSRWLEGSISHFQYIPELGYPSCTAEYCHYAYDFTDSWHFPLVASKAGTVYASRDTCNDGDTGCTNYIVLKNASEGTYQIYLHLAHGTIPDKLTNGATVQRGQYLGDSDDTGYSTSQHVHFMVVNTIWLSEKADKYYWGYSIDIRFADVAINNGIPRNCYEVTHFPIYDGATECLGDKSDPRNPANDWYVSGNIGAYPPTGTLSRPAAGATVNSGSNPLIDVTANASDDVHVDAVRLVAWLSDQWVEIGPKITQAASPGLYDWDVDLCAVGPLNGSLQVALRVWDHEGNVAQALDPRTIQVDHACPPPVSQLKPAESFDSTAVRLSWDANSSGAGLDLFELQWRNEPGTWDIAKTLTFPASQRSVWFAGDPGQSYAFRMRAFDLNGQPELWLIGDQAETGATLPSTCTADGYEADDDPTQAKSLALGEWTQRNLCGAGNPDWLRVNFEKDGDYLINAPSNYGGAAVRATVYADDGTTVVASGESPGVGQGAMVRFRQAAAGSYYIKIEPLSTTLFGTDAVYDVMVMELKEIFLPLVRR
jgi:murein DD-endopeptidase MepM/ murein hydrolase activator NlpD